MNSSAEWGSVLLVTPAYAEIIEFIATGTTPHRVVAFHPSAATKQPVADLLQREKTLGLTAAETTELDHYMQLEHLMRLAKARARRSMAHE